MRCTLLWRLAWACAAVLLSFTLAASSQTVPEDQTELACKSSDTCSLGQVQRFVGNIHSGEHCTLSLHLQEGIVSVVHRANNDACDRLV